MTALFDQLLINAVRQGDHTGVREALAAGANPNVLESAAPHRSALILALSEHPHGDPDGEEASTSTVIVADLLAAGADPNLASRQGLLPIHSAILCSDTAAIELLHGAGADLNRHDAEGDEPLVTALVKADPRAAAVLLACGAVVTAENMTLLAELCASTPRFEPALAEALAARPGGLDALRTQGAKPSHPPALRDYLAARAARDAAQRVLHSVDAAPGGIQ